MSQRHPIQNDVTMLITIVTMSRNPVFIHDCNAREAIETLYRVQDLHPFFLYGFVIMPDHLHILLKILPPGSVSKIIGSFKSNTTRNLGLHQLWQERFHIKEIKNRSAALHYIHANPVKAGLVQIPDSYAWSSASGKWDISSLDEW
ncbi:MAG: transposase [Candidatus Peribacteria bacterium]|nr:transposase [Candidatus Peribacteria bacterium]